MGWTNPTTWTTGQVPSAANLNAHIRDNLNAAGDHTAWSTYQPNLTCTGTTDPSYADGGQAGQYLRAGNLVFYQYRVTIGGDGAGNGVYWLSLPVNGNFDNDLRCGSGYLYDASAYAAYTTVHYSSSTAAAVVRVMWNAKTADGIVSNASPFTFGGNDVLAGQLIYRAAG